MLVWQMLPKVAFFTGVRHMTETTLFILIVSFVLVMYCLGTWATNRAVDSVRDMDKHDDAEAKYAEMIRTIKEMSNGSR